MKPVFKMIAIVVGAPLALGLIVAALTTIANGLGL